MRKHNKIIAFQGIAGAHADLACRMAYPYLDTKPAASFLQAIQWVEEGKADICMIPIENSQAGRVAEIHNILPKTSLHIIGEYFVPIAHYLMAPKGAMLSDVRQVYSHPQALMQCQKTLTMFGHPVECIERSNTAVAAQQVAEWNDPHKAAIASSLAAELYGLTVLREHVEDASDNTTVFIAMAKEAADPNPKEGQVITSVLFTVKNIPSAFYKALGGFAAHHINLLKVESYIPAGQSKKAQFFISFEGSPRTETVSHALASLASFCTDVRILGSYYADKARYAS